MKATLIVLIVLISGCSTFTGLVTNKQAANELGKFEIYSSSNFNADGSRKTKDQLRTGTPDQDLAVILMTGEELLGADFGVDLMSSGGLKIADTDLSNKYCLFTDNATLLTDGGYYYKPISENLKQLFAERGFNPSDNNNRLYTPFDSCLSVVDNVLYGSNRDLYSGMAQQSAARTQDDKVLLLGRDASNAYYPPSIIIIDRDLIPQFNKFLQSSMAVSGLFVDIDPAKAESQYIIIGSIPYKEAVRGILTEAQKLRDAVATSKANREKAYRASGDTVASVFASFPDPTSLQSNSGIALRACFGPGLLADDRAEEIIKGISLSSDDMIKPIINQWYVWLNYEYGEKYDPNTMDLKVISEINDLNDVPQRNRLSSVRAAQRVLETAYDEMSESNSISNSCNVYFDFAPSLKYLLSKSYKGNSLDSSFNFGNTKTKAELMSRHAQNENQKFLKTIQAQGFSGPDQYKLFNDTFLSKAQVMRLDEIGVDSISDYLTVQQKIARLSGNYFSTSDVGYDLLTGFLESDSDSAQASYVDSAVKTSKRRAQAARKAAEERRKKREAREREKAKNYPYYAVIECGYGSALVDIRGCFAGFGNSAETTITVRTDNQTREAKHYQFDSIGQQRDNKLYIDLTRTFSIRAQNSHDTLSVTLKVYNRLTNELVGSDMAARQYGVASLRN